MMRKFGVGAIVLVVLLLCFMIWKETDLFRGQQSRSRFWSKWGLVKRPNGGKIEVETLL